MDKRLILEALNVRVLGNGDKYLVLGHGFGTDQSAWQRIHPSFSPHYRVILYDLVCAGSVNPDYFDFRRYTTLDPYVDDLLAILDALSVDCCTYVGHSASAMIGILASIRRPELFSKLILFGASPRFLNDGDYHGGFEDSEIEKTFTAMEANYESWVNGFAPLAIGADVPAAVQEYSRTLFTMRPDIALFVSRVVFNSDLRGVIGLVKTPCCIIQTSKDVSVPMSVVMYLRDHLGGQATVEMLDTEGHLPHLSAPELFVGKLWRALSRPTKDNGQTPYLRSLNVRVLGNGDKYLVLAHGFGTDQSGWQRIHPSFSPYYRVILYDLVCAGSVNPDYFDFRRYTNLDSYVDDLLVILDTLRVDRCTYVGHSVSAMIGILASIRRPELFSKLILVGASPRFLNDRDYHGGFEHGEIEKVFTAMEANYEAWVNGFAPLAVGADVPAAVQEFSRTLFNMRPDIALFVSRVVFNSDLRGVLGLVKTPCCIIQTAKDVSVPLSVVKYLRDHLGGRPTVEILDTEGHLPHLSALQLLIRKLRRALSS